MAWWLSAPQPPPFFPHPGQSCLRPTPAWNVSKPSPLPLTCKQSPPHPKSTSSLAPRGHQPHHPTSAPTLRINFQPQPVPYALSPQQTWSPLLVVGVWRSWLRLLCPRDGGCSRGTQGRASHRGERFRVALPLEGSEGPYLPTRQQSPWGTVGLAGGDVLGTRQVLLPAVGMGLGMGMRGSLMKRLAWGTPGLAAGPGGGGGGCPQGLSPAGGPVTSSTVPRAALGRNTPLPACPRLAGPGLCPWGWGGQAGDSAALLPTGQSRQGRGPPQEYGSFSSSPQRPWGLLSCSAAQLRV